MISRLIQGSITRFAPAAACCIFAINASAQDSRLTPQSGHELGITLTDYRYVEPDLLRNKATKVGMDYAFTHAIGSEWPNRNRGWFLRGEARYASGAVEYSGVSGSLSNRPDWYYELRGTVGKDIQVGGHTLSPYVGLGFRHLLNDLRGLTDTGRPGFRRQSEYVTLPIGVAHRMKLNGGANLMLRMEYARLLQGKQVTRLSDAIDTLPDVTNTQRNGYGLRLDAVARFGKWSVGPTAILWRIKASDSVLGFVEPENRTTEVGIRAARQF